MHTPRAAQPALIDQLPGLQIMAILREYLESGDVEEAGACIGELQLPQYDFYIVKRALTLACDRHDREREATARLLADLYGQGISPTQMTKARFLLAYLLRAVCLLLVYLLRAV